MRPPEKGSVWAERLRSSWPWRSTTEIANRASRGAELRSVDGQLKVSRGLWRTSLNAFLNWSAYLTNLMVVFYVSPFVVRSLGNASYGVWSVLVALVGYMGLVDLGVRASTGRYITYFVGSGEQEKINQVLNVSLAFYTIAGAVLLALSLGIGSGFHAFFPHVPPGVAGEVTSALLLLSLNIWLSFCGSVFSQCLIAVDRFDLQAVIRIGSSILQGFLVLAVLRHGGGIRALGAAQCAATLFGAILTYMLARQCGVPFVLGVRFLKLAMLRELISFSIWAFVMSSGTRFLNQLGTLFLAKWSGFAQVTYFSLGFTLVDFASTFTQQALAVLDPRIQRLAGRRESGAVLNQTLLYCRLTAVAGILVFGGIVFFSSEFFSLWMGAGYESSARVASILSIGALLILSNRGFVVALWGVGEIRALAMLSVAEGCTSVVFALFAIRVFGLGVIGAAWAIVVPAAIFSFYFILLYASRTLGFGARRYLRGQFARGIGACLVSWPVFYTVSEVRLGSGWMLLALKACVLTLLYFGVAYALLLRSVDWRELVREES